MCNIVCPKKQNLLIIWRNCEGGWHWKTTKNSSRRPRQSTVVDTALVHGFEHKHSILSVYVQEQFNLCQLWVGVLLISSPSNADFARHRPLKLFQYSNQWVKSRETDHRERIAENAIASLSASAHQFHTWGSRRPTDIVATDLDQIVTSGSCVWQKQASSAFLLEWQSYLQSKQNVSALGRSPDTIPCLSSHLPMHLDFLIGCRISADESSGLKEPGLLKQK